MSHSVISLNRKQRTFFLLKGATHFILTFTLVDLLRTVSQGTGLLLNNNHTQANNTLLTNKTKELSVLYFGSTRTISAAPQIRICHSFLIPSNLTVLGGLKKNAVNILYKMRRDKTQRNLLLKALLGRNPTRLHPEKFDRVHRKEASLSKPNPAGPAFFQTSRLK